MNGQSADDQTFGRSRDAPSQASTKAGAPCGCKWVKRAAHLSAKEWSELTMGPTIPQIEISYTAILPKLVALRLAPCASLDQPNLLLAAFAQPQYRARYPIIITKRFDHLSGCEFEAQWGYPKGIVRRGCDLGISPSQCSPERHSGGAHAKSSSRAPKRTTTSAVRPCQPMSKYERSVSHEGVN
jgi:hypothetical protein